jgi:hypothetical protein
MFTLIYVLLLLFYYVNFFIKLFYVKEISCTIFIEENFVVFLLSKLLLMFHLSNIFLTLYKIVFNFN